MPETNVAYGSQANPLLSHDVLVTEVSGNQVRFTEILGWNYGAPNLGQSRSATVESFEKQYPHRIEFVNAP